MPFSMSGVEGRETEIPEATVSAITAGIEPAQGELFDKPNVVGMGVGTNVKAGKDSGTPCVKVLVSQKLPLELVPTKDRVPPKVGRYQTDVEEVGVLFAGHPFATSEVEVNVAQPHISTPAEGEVISQPLMATALTQRIRPAQGGFSVAHRQVTAGTIATAVYDRTPFPGMPPKYYILSNNHVLANSNNASLGDPILQPGPADGGTWPGDAIARLSRFIPIRFRTPISTPLNYVDAAIAQGRFHSLDRQIYWIGYVKGVRGSVSVGEILQKTGRTTNYTTGRVTAINATVDVNYGGGRIARFAQQIVTGPMSAGGDSGSLVLDRNENAVGLLFAGSASSTILNNIVYVAWLLGIRVV